MNNYMKNIKSLSLNLWMRRFQKSLKIDKIIRQKTYLKPTMAVDFYSITEKKGRENWDGAIVNFPTRVL